jgi:hypothetical protein
MARNCHDGAHDETLTTNLNMDLTLLWVLF